MSCEDFVRVFLSLVAKFV